MNLKPNSAARKRRSALPVGRDILIAPRTGRRAGTARPTFLLTLLALLLLSMAARAQVNSGSDGHDGAFNPTTSIVINMVAPPDGIYHYTSVNISNGVAVTFIPNANNTPAIWLAQGTCSIDAFTRRA